MNNTESLLLYFITFAFSLLFVMIYEKHYINHNIKYKTKLLNININSLKKIMCITCIILPIIIIQGFRDGVGTDYFNYYNIILAINREDILTIKNYANEPLFVLESIVLYRIYKTPVSVFVFNATLMNILFFFAVSYYKGKINMVITYFLYYMTCLPVFFNMERQGIASLFVWMSFQYIEQKKFSKFLLCILCAIGFHNTAVFFAPLYIFAIHNHLFKKYLFRILVFILILSPMYLGELVKYILFFTKMNFSSYYENYSHFIGNAINSTRDMRFLYLAMFLIPAFIILYIFMKIKSINILWILCAVLCGICYLLDKYISDASRLIYYCFFGVLCISGQTCIYNKNHFNRYIFSIYYFATGIIYFVRMFYIIGNSEIFPYNFI